MKWSESEWCGRKREGGEVGEPRCTLAETPGQNVRHGHERAILVVGIDVTSRGLVGYMAIHGSASLAEQAEAFGGNDEE